MGGGEVLNRRQTYSVARFSTPQQALFTVSNMCFPLFLAIRQVPSRIHVVRADEGHVDPAGGSWVGKVKGMQMHIDKVLEGLGAEHSNSMDVLHGRLDAIIDHFNIQAPPHPTASKTNITGALGQGAEPGAGPGAKPEATDGEEEEEKERDPRFDMRVNQKYGDTRGAGGRNKSKPTAAARRKLSRPVNARGDGSENGAANIEMTPNVASPRAQAQGQQQDHVGGEWQTENPLNNARRATGGGTASMNRASKSNGGRKVSPSWARLGANRYVNGVSNVPSESDGPSHGSSGGNRQSGGVEVEMSGGGERGSGNGEVRTTNGDFERRGFDGDDEIDGRRGEAGWDGGERDVAAAGDDDVEHGEVSMEILGRRGSTGDEEDML